MPSTADFAAVRIEGAILPADLLQRVAAGDPRLEGLRPEDYHLVGEKLNEAANHAWGRLLPAWEAFRAEAERLPPGDDGLAFTLKRWLLPFWKTLEYGQLEPATPVQIEDKAYPISHVRYSSPIHLVSFRRDLDRRLDTPQGKLPSPHGMVQELLNRSQAHLWAFVSNGLKLRILRDNIRLTRQAYVEFDLQAIFDGRAYSDFSLLWRLCHESRVNAERPEQCWLERWSKVAQEQGLRALDQLRVGVEKAVESLGRGFLYPSNADLVAKLRAGTLPAQDYYRQLLRVVYRLLFLFVAEDRGLLLDPQAGEVARDRYARFYSTARLRRIAERIRGTQHADLHQGLELILTRLGTAGCPELGLPALGGLFDPAGTPDLAGCRVPNADLLEAVRALSVVSDGRSLRPVDYRNLGAEELGSVYESLLELHPRFDPAGGTFALDSAAGNERKTTGSYYTPRELITCLLDSALDPVLEEAVRKSDPEAAILSLKVCDPACGSGHFLIAASHRIAKRLASVRTHEEEPAPDAIRHSLRDVVGRCLFGVDINPMAVELCQVALWMEALEPGKPLSFLEHHVQCGNSLLGTTPVLLAKGIPDEAFEPNEGDDRAYCREWKGKNKEDRRGQARLFDEDAAPWDQLGNLAAAMAAVDELPDDSLDQVRAKAERYGRLVAEGSYRTSGHFLADLWCAAFVWRKTKLFDYPVTERIFRRVEKSPHDVTPWMYDEVRRLARQYRFLHWHLAFPGVFRPPAKGESPDNELTGLCGGFDAVLGNPPWVRQELLKPVKPLLRLFSAYKSTADASVYFLERACHVTRPGGLFGMLTPNKWFRADYGDLLRRTLRDRTQARLIIDFGHTRTLFPAADTFPAAVVLMPTDSRVPDTVTFRFVKAHDSDREAAELGLLVQERAAAIPHGQLQEARWEMEDPRVSELLRRLRSTGRRLSAEVGRPPIRGLLTGFNAAFYIDTNTRDALVSAHPDCEGLIRRFLRGRDVKRWSVQWAGQWHIIIPSSQNRRWPWSDCEDEASAESKFEETYPSLYQHLKRYEKELRAREDQGRFWWELRACDYYTLFDHPKLLVQCIAFHSQFALNTDGHVVNNKVVFLPTGDLYVLAVLNSRVTWWIVSRVFQHMKDEGLYVDGQFLTDLPVPETTDQLREDIRAEVGAMLAVVGAEHASVAVLLEHERRLNELVMQAFGLSPDDRLLLEETLPPRDPLAVLEHQLPQETASTATQAPPIPAEAILRMYVILLLQTWGKEVSRDDLTLGLAFALNDGARKTILGLTVAEDELRQLDDLPDYVVRLDDLLGRLASDRFVRLRVHEGTQLLCVGQAAPPPDGAPDAEREKVREAVQAAARVPANQKAALQGRWHVRQPATS